MSKESITSSKTAVKFQSSWEGPGSYTTVHNILTSEINPKNCPMEMSITRSTITKKLVCVRETLTSTVPLSICATLRHILPQPPTSLKYDEFLMSRY